MKQPLFVLVTALSIFLVGCSSPDGIRNFGATLESWTKKLGGFAKFSTKRIRTHEWEAEKDLKLASSKDVIEEAADSKFFPIRVSDGFLIKDKQGSCVLTNELTPLPKGYYIAVLR